MLCTFADIILYPVQIKIKNMYVIFKKKNSCNLLANNIFLNFL